MGYSRRIRQEMRMEVPWLSNQEADDPRRLQMLLRLDSFTTADSAAYSSLLWFLMLTQSKLPARMPTTMSPWSLPSMQSYAHSKLSVWGGADARQVRPGTSVPTADLHRIMQTPFSMWTLLWRWVPCSAMSSVSEEGHTDVRVWKGRDRGDLWRTRRSSAML